VKEPESKLELREKSLILSADKPLIQKKDKSKFSILDALKIEEKEEVFVEFFSTKDQPQNHFSETDLQKEWHLFLEEIKNDNSMVYNAINGFKLTKINEHDIEVCYPSETAKVEFDNISSKFLNHFKHKVNNFQIMLNFKMDIKLKKEILTKRKIFDKFAEINPVLNDLNDLMKFDFS
jgi:DNA polymerase-3 subunit gamma/tau